MRTAKKIGYALVGILIFLVFLYFTNNISYNSNETISFGFSFTQNGIFGVNWFVFLIVLIPMLIFATAIYWSVKG